MSTSAVGRKQTKTNDTLHDAGNLQQFSTVSVQIYVLMSSSCNFTPFFAFPLCAFEMAKIYMCVNYFDMILNTVSLVCLAKKTLLV